MKRSVLLWTYLLGFGSFLLGVLMTEFCGFRIAGQVFGPSSRFGGLIISCYSAGLFLWSAGWANYVWGSRVSVLEEKIARLTAASTPHA